MQSRGVDEVSHSLNIPSGVQLHLSNEFDMTHKLTHHQVEVTLHWPFSFVYFLLFVFYFFMYFKKFTLEGIPLIIAFEPNLKEKNNAKRKERTKKK